MEKMREDFENWVITRNVCIKYGAKLRMCPDGSYYDYRINDRWLAWKASRAELCVELPKNPYFSTSDEAVSAFEYGIDVMKELIEANGVKVK